jgi:hypothetical protein
MKSFNILIFIFLTYLNSFGQDTCYTKFPYGINSETGQYVEINGIRMYYETYGEGVMQPLLLIHGNGGSIYSERYQIEYFKDKYFTIVADSRFHGNESFP